MDLIISVNNVANTLLIIKCAISYYNIVARLFGVGKVKKILQKNRRLGKENYSISEIVSKWLPFILDSSIHYQQVYEYDVELLQNTSYDKVQEEITSMV